MTTLQRVNDYRLSGYWYPFRRKTTSGRADDFYPGNRPSDVVALYDFDARLRMATFSAVAQSNWRSEHYLVTSSVALIPVPILTSSCSAPRHEGAYRRWLVGCEFELRQSSEYFVAHHHA
ncbi:Abi family protein [Brevibacterium sediminis]|uniref:Abi family protein n=1 Tax=Brevibacterium sediminis TaxID=1857024 RepID=UPI001C5A3CE5